MTHRSFRANEYICFCKQIINKVTKRNGYRFTVDVTSRNKYEEEVTVTHNICGEIFRRGEYFIRGTIPYGKLTCPPLPDLRMTGENRGVMHHLAGLCPRHAIMFEDRMYRTMIEAHGHNTDTDSVHSADDPEDPPVCEADSSSSSSATGSPPVKNKRNKPSGVNSKPRASTRKPVSNASAKANKKPNPSTRKAEPKSDSKIRRKGTPPPTVFNIEDDDKESLSVTIKKNKRQSQAIVSV